MVAPHKAWLEMIHRYFAGTLGLLIFALTATAIVRYRKLKEGPIALPLALTFLVVGQAALGMWTVTWLLLPAIVMAHLLGGLLIITLLFKLSLKPQIAQAKHHWRIFALLGLLIVFGQITLGGWTSANYAALSCTGFPTCNGSFVPSMDFENAFKIITPIGENYEGGVLSLPARVAIQMVHRYGALITAFYVSLFALALIVLGAQTLRKLGFFLLLVLGAQLSLGIMNVLFMLPISIAVAHNLVAVLLVLTLVAIFHHGAKA